MDYILMIVLLLHMVISCALSTDTVLEVNDPSPQHVTSLGFPLQCCTAMNIVLKKNVDKKYLKLLFTDIDLPPASTLLIYGLKRSSEAGEPNEKIPITYAKYFEGAWERPVVWYDDGGLYVEFQTDNTSNPDSISQTYVGFNFTYWADDDPWKIDKPLTTECPPIGGVVESGKVDMKSILQQPHITHHRLFCVWQLKPVPNSDLLIYVNIQTLLGPDSNLRIHNGITSSSPLLFTSSEISSPVRFNTTNGFYISLAKPVNDGDFEMTHGVFTPSVGSDGCEITIEGSSVDGFKCGAICIPVGNKCNEIRDCLQGEDELREMCMMSTTTVAPPILTTTLAPCPRGRCKDGRCPRKHNEKCPEEACSKVYKRCEGTLLCVHASFESCPGEPCNYFEKTCADGSCISKYSLDGCEDSSVGCEFEERRCKDGSCIRQHDSCPEETCPPSKPYQCGRMCFPYSAVCNGNRDCADGRDEFDCSSSDLYPIDQRRNEVNKVLFPILGVIAALVFFGALYGTAMKYCRDSGTVRTSSAARFPQRPQRPWRTQEAVPVSTTNTFDDNASHHHRGRGSPAENGRPDRANRTSPNSNSTPAASPTAPPSYEQFAENEESYPVPEAPPPSYSSLG